MHNTFPANPWYREPWPWIILGILGLGVCSGLSILLIGLKHPPEMVHGDYARLGKALVSTGAHVPPAQDPRGDLVIDGEDVVLEPATQDASRQP